MKRLIVLLTVVLAFGAAKAQDLTLRTVEFYDVYTAVAGDTVSGTTVDYLTIKVDKPFMYYYDVQWAADSSGDATNISLQLQGSNDNSNWYNVGSAATWALSSTDTIVQFTNMTSISTSATIAASTEYHAIDTTGGTIGSGAGYGGYVDTVAVGAKTITETLTEPRVGWRFLRVAATGAASTTRAEITSLTVAIRED